MGKLTRAQLLKGGAVGAAALALIPARSNVAVASSEGGHVAVHIHARVEKATATQPGPAALDISIDAAGERRQSTPFAPLSGSGWDTGAFDSPSQADACIYTLRGALDGDEIDLHGRVIFSNPSSSFSGAHVETHANLKTGHVTWTFTPVGGPHLVFTCNVGVVTKID